MNTKEVEAGMGTNVETRISVFSSRAIPAEDF